MVSEHTPEPWLTIRFILNILWSSLRHPGKTTWFDRNTGKVIKHE